MDWYLLISVQFIFKSMKKLIFLSFVLLLSAWAKAQYGTANAILDELEARRGINKELRSENLNDRKFVLIKDFDDHTERNFIIIKGKEATYVEMFDDKSNGKTSSNIFTGDYVRTKNNILSLRFDRLEGKKIAVPIAKTMLMTKQKKILYLLDVNSKERWIDETAF